MNILLTGVTSCRNRGVDALVRSILDGVLRSFPNARIIILSSTPDFDADALAGYPVSFLQQYPSYSGWSPKKMARRALGLLEPARRPLRKAMDGIDLCLATGGDVFTSDYDSLQTHLAPLRLALSRGIPICFIGQTIGPFKNHEDARAWTEVARRASLICVREKISFDYVTDLLKDGPAPPVVHAADVAFLLEPAPAETAARLAGQIGLDKSRPCIALSVSRSISSIRKLSHEAHFQAWQTLLEKILSETDWQILLVPHVRGIMAKGNDLLMQTNLMRRLGWPDRIRCASANLNSSEYKALLAQCDLAVAERMHAGIGALSSSVPTILIGYSIKSRGVLLEFFDKETVDRRLLMPVESFMENPAALWKNIQDVFADRLEIARTLREQLPEVRRRAELNFNFPVALMQKGGRTATQKSVP